MDNKQETKTGFKAWLENFFYHYKWHTIIATILIFTVTICTFQMCQKESYDIYVLYAGSKNISKKVDDNNITEYQQLMTAMRYAAKDYDGDGSITVSLDTLYMLSEREIEEINAQLKEENEKNNTDYTINMDQLSENNTVFRDRMMYSEYYVCFLSKDLYESYKEINGVTMFVPLSGYAGNAEGLEYLDDSAIYLKSTAFGSLPVIRDLPEDTVIALRTLSAIASHYDKSQNVKNFENAEDMIRNILSYK